MLLIKPGFQNVFRALGLDSCATVVKHFMTGETPAGPVTLRRISVTDDDGAKVSAFYKQYEYTKPAWKFIGRASKARCEFANYTVFARLGVRAADAIACGEERTALGRLRRAFIVTREIPLALTLGEFFDQHCSNRADANSRALRGALLEQLAQMTRYIHDASFFHHDLVWRNILVSPDNKGAAQLWWIDCPRGEFDRWSPWRRGRQVKDLALLDLVGALRCSMCERLQFMKDYLGKSRLNVVAKTLIRDVLHYKVRKWPGYRE